MLPWLVRHAGADLRRVGRHLAGARRVDLLAGRLGCRVLAVRAEICGGGERRELSVRGRGGRRRGRRCGVSAEAVLLFEPLLVTTMVATTAAITRMAPTAEPMIVKSRRRFAWAALRSSCRSSLRLAVARRCSLVGTAAVLLVVRRRDGDQCSQSAPSVPGIAERRRCDPREREVGNWATCWSRGFRRGCCSATATSLRRGRVPTPSSSIRASGPSRPLRRILDENRLTPAAVLLTHGHIDHMWSAQKVADTYGCPVYIHPEDRHMLVDPIKGFGPRLAQVAFGALFREPRQLVELDRDGDKVELGGITVTIDHTPGHTRGSVVFRVTRGRRDATRAPWSTDRVRSSSPVTRCSSSRSAAPTCLAAAVATCSARS